MFDVGVFVAEGGGEDGEAEVHVVGVDAGFLFEDHCGGVCVCGSSISMLGVGVEEENCVPNKVLATNGGGTKV